MFVDYRGKIKIQLMREAVKNFQEEFNKKPNKFFTLKDNFYFILDKGYKYIHKESIRMIYSNYDTYTDSLIPDPDEFVEVKDTFNFKSLNLEETKYFYKVKYIEGELITSVSEKEFNKLKGYWKFQGFTPFYNQMAYNLVKNENGIFLIDYKHFEYLEGLPFFIFFYNEKFNLNTIYYEKDLDLIKEHLSKDYNLKGTKYVKYN